MDSGLDYYSCCSSDDDEVFGSNEECGPRNRPKTLGRSSSVAFQDDFKPIRRQSSIGGTTRRKLSSSSSTHMPVRRPSLSARSPKRRISSSSSTCSLRPMLKRRKIQATAPARTRRVTRSSSKSGLPRSTAKKRVVTRKSRVAPRRRPSSVSRSTTNQYCDLCSHCTSGNPTDVSTIVTRYHVVKQQTKM